MIKKILSLFLILMAVGAEFGSAQTAAKIEEVGGGIICFLLKNSTFVELIKIKKDVVYTSFFISAPNA